MASVPAAEFLTDWRRSVRNVLAHFTWNGQRAVKSLPGEQPVTADAAQGHIASHAQP